LPFYLAPNDYHWFWPFVNYERHKLRITFSDYLKKVDDAKASDIIKSMAMELLKVSFIRNIKSDRFKILLWVVLITTCLFFITYIVYNVETDKAISIVESLKSHKVAPCKIK
jgi:hypothetical protein